jgi:hypothetical protein
LSLNYYSSDPTENLFDVLYRVAVLAIAASATITIKSASET